MTAPAAFLPIELDALQESMNIGFGQAARALSEVIDMHVVLSVPKISLAAKEGMAELICAEIGNPADFSLVEQRFRGSFAGTGFLLVPDEEGRKLAELFGGLEGAEQGPGMSALEDEVILEIGNIIIGACVGKIAELLGDGVSYLPPRVIGAPVDRAILSDRLGSQAGLGLVFKTVFHFDKRDVYGLLFLVTSEDAAEWIHAAVRKLVEGLV